MWINGNLSLASPTGNNTFHYLRSGDPSNDTCRSAFSFVSSGGYTEYGLQHSGQSSSVDNIAGHYSGLPNSAWRRILGLGFGGERH